MVSQNRSGLTARLGGAIAEIRDIPEAARAVARRGTTDCLGVMLAGSAEPVVGRVRAALGLLCGNEARLIPGGEPCSAQTAALLNGIAGHVLDYDDVALDGHPSAVLVPALLAESEALGSTGADFLRGYVAGYETWAALWAASASPLHSLGRHPSSHFGPLAAAAACAVLRGLNAAQTTHALGLAAAQAGGLIANFGSMAKSFQVGRSAEAGLFAARLAHAGVDASTHVLEDEAGFLNVLGGGARNAALGFGHPDWWILTEGLDIKTHPVCNAALRLVDAALQLVQDGAPALQAITRITIRLGRLQSKILHSMRPATVLEAKFSAEFVVAASLVAGHLGLAELTPDFLARADVQALIARSVRSLDDAMGNQPFSPFDQVVLHLEDGTELTSAPVFYAAGSRHNPPPREIAAGKFMDSASGILWPDAAKRLFTQFWDMPDHKKVVDLLEHAGITRKRYEH